MVGGRCVRTGATPLPSTVTMAATAGCLVLALVCVVHGVVVDTTGAGVTLTRATAVMYDKHTHSIMVGEKDHLFKLHVSNLTEVMNITLTDFLPATPTEEACVPHWEDTDALNPGVQHFGAGINLESGRCAALPFSTCGDERCQPFSCSSEQCCREAYFYSTCSGNVYYFMLPFDDTSFISCSSIGMCQRLSLDDLSDFNPPPDDYPLGYYCGLNAQFTELGDAKALPGENGLQFKTENFCPVFRYGPPEGLVTVNRLDTAAAVIAPDLSDGGSNALYLLSQREALRDNFPDDVEISNHLHVISKRTLTDFTIKCKDEPGTCSIGNYDRADDAGILIPDTTGATFEAQYTLRQQHVYTAAFARDDYIYFVIEEYTAAAGLVSKVMRFCSDTYPNRPANYFAFNGFVKTQLACGGDTQLSAVVHVPAGSVLAASMQTTSSDLLFAVTKSGAQGQLCVYSFDDFSHTDAATLNTNLNIDATLDLGHGVNGDKAECARSSAPATEPVFVLGKQLPFAQDAGNKKYTALVVDVVHGHTLVYIGTSTGQVIKIHAQGIVESVSTLQPIGQFPTPEVLHTIPGGLEITDMTLAAEDNGVVAMTASVVAKIDLADCGSFSTCNTCLDAVNPYCGWCILEGKCSERRECAAAWDDSTDLRHTLYTGGFWFQDLNKGSNGSCPLLAGVTPEEVTVGHEVTINVSVNGVPSTPPVGEQFFCTLDGYEPKVGVMADGVLSCTFNQPTLAVADVINSTVTVGIASGVSAVAAVPLVLDIAPTPNGSDVNTNDIVLFDCGRAQPDGCGTCAKLPHVCGWCVYDNTCTHTADECRATNQWIANFGTCPLVELVGPTFVHVESGDGTTISIAGSNLPAPQGGDVYECSFSPATGLASATTTATFVNSTVATCPSPADDGSGIQNDGTGMVVRTSSLLLNGFRVDGSSELSVDFFDCVEKGGGVADGDCPLCLSTSVNVYGCGWCKNGNPSQHLCTLESACPNALEDWIPNSVTALDQCPKPELLAVEPAAAPLAGGTSIDLSGENLARSINDIKSVIVAGENCSVTGYDVVNGIITCSLPAVGAAKSGSITMTLVSEISATLPGPFAFLQPTVSRFSPTRTPEAGGSIITITGTGLAAGNDVTIDLATNTECTVTARTTTTLTCKTAATPAVRRRAAEAESVCLKIDDMGSCAARSGQALHAFNVVPNPNIASLTAPVGPVSGGNTFVVVGTSMDAIQAPTVTASHPTHTLNSTASCEPIDATSFRCTAPNGSDVRPHVTGAGLAVTLDFTMDNVQQQLPLSFTYFPDPTVSNISPLTGAAGAQLTVEGTGMSIGGNPEVFIGNAKATFFAAPSDLFLTVLVPDNAAEGEQPIRVVHGNYVYEHSASFTVESSSSLPSAVIGAAGGVGGFLIIALIVVFVVSRLRLRRRQDQEQRLAKQMRDLEAQVVEVCRQGFTELQAGTQLAVKSASAQPYSFPEFAAKFLYTHLDTHPMPDGPASSGLSEELELFHQLLLHEDFVVAMVSSLESRGKDFGMKDRCHVAALLMTSLPRDGAYTFTVLKALLSPVVKSAIEKKTPKLMLRRTETVAEKLLSSWLAFGMYDYLTSTVGLPLLNMMQAFRLQIDKGPVDCITGACMYTINGDYLLREKMDTRRIHVIVSSPSDGPDVEIEINSCDAISQIKVKALDAQGDKGYSKLPKPEQLLLVEHGYPDQGRVLSDVDDASEYDGTKVKVNTAQFYGLTDKTRLRLISVHETASTEHKPLSKKLSKRLSKSKLAVPRDAPRWHLVDASAYEQGVSKIPSEVYLSYLMTVKGIVHPFVDDMVRKIFSGKNVPPVIKALFDLLDELAAENGIRDGELLHVWKNNALPLRFWINIIKNPEFVYDVHKTQPINACLSTVAQVIMDSCSVAEQQLGKHSPANKHLYRAEVQKYKALVKQYYEDVSKASTVPGSELDDAFQTTSHSANVCSPSNSRCMLLEYAAPHSAAIGQALRVAGHQAMADDFHRISDSFHAAKRNPSPSDSVADMPDPTGGYITVGTLDRRASMLIQTDLFEPSSSGGAGGDKGFRESALINEDMFASSLVEREQEEPSFALPGSVRETSIDGQSRVEHDIEDDASFGFDTADMPPDTVMFGFGDLIGPDQ
eukprot:m.78202 g.78202  ORF g.78202 m.78202 type:complete len:2126 (-) comp14575_c0_seq2:2755-9132(-)